MTSLYEDGGIKDRMMHFIEAQILRHYGQEELAAMSKHEYTCLATPHDLEKHGLTHMVCRVDMPEQPVAAFNSSVAASMQCDTLNGFAQQDHPELAGPDTADVELAEANRLAAERETMTLAEKVKLAQAAVVTKG